MRYELLGPPRLVRDGEEFLLSAAKLELLLCTLLARTDQTVASHQLLDELWPDHPPRRAEASLHVYVSQLRKFLAGLGDGEQPIVTRSPGYMLRLGPDRLDLQDFQETLAGGREPLTKGHPKEAGLAFEAALALGRGPVLGGLGGGPILAGLTTRFEESRLECLELMIEAKLRQNRHREVVGLLYSLITEHPLREAFYQFLMVALHRSDRQADALLVYQRARRTMIDEVGVEPCRALRDLHEAILLENRMPPLQIAV
ncbi:AfsR/SARP family transcriptional regulator [Kitasatospora sp. LaBMicrA B282]|uniref:AfsR/SARP family transcriptional regulator n=1 Tax=Kitasatospora sp. LaBMicrA B282 TaxID=3420949 RepID=UPI003D0A197A